MNNVPRLLVRNAEIVNEGRKFRGYLTVDADGLFGEVRSGEPSGELIAATTEIVDAGGRLLLPGVIDTHVHFRDPGLTHKGDMASESLAALAGGVTSFIDMPNTRPATVAIADWEAKMDRAAEVSAINYGFYIGATADNLDMLARADYSRVAAIKLFLGSSTGNMLLDSPDSLRSLFGTVPALIAAHAESEPLITAGKERALTRFGSGKVPIPMHSVIRSRRACVEASRRACSMAIETGARLHLLHISTADELLLLASGPVAGKRITAETCPNYLLFTALDYPRLGSRCKCNPAVKLPADRDALRSAVSADLIDTIATDHAPHLPVEKEGDALSAASGMPMIQFSLASMLDLAEAGCFSIEKVVEKMSHNPATLYRIDRRGFLRPGYHADFTLVARRPQAVTKAGILSRCGWSPLEGRTLSYTPDAVYLNGALAYTSANGFVSNAPRGLSPHAQPLRFNP